MVFVTYWCNTNTITNNLVIWLYFKDMSLIFCCDFCLFVCFVLNVKCHHMYVMISDTEVIYHILNTQWDRHMEMKLTNC